METRTGWRKDSIFRNLLISMLGVLALGTVVAEFLISGIHAVRFMSYFTIWSNLAIGLGLPVAVLWPGTKFGQFVSRAGFRTALAAYILLVSAVFNLLLRGRFSFHGWMAVTNALLHVVIPALYAVTWLLFTEPGSLRWRNLVHWTWFPLVYLAWTFLHGALTGWYPYPFLDVEKLGYTAVMLNSAMLTLALIAIGSVLIVVNKVSSLRADSRQ